MPRSLEKMGQINKIKEENMVRTEHKTKYRFEQSVNGSGAVHKLYIYDEVSEQV